MPDAFARMEMRLVMQGQTDWAEQRLSFSGLEVPAHMQQKLLQDVGWQVLHLWIMEPYLRIILTGSFMHCVQPWEK